MPEYIIKKNNYYPLDEYEYGDYIGKFNSYEKAEKYLFECGYSKHETKYQTNKYELQSSDWYSIAYIIELSEPDLFRLFSIDKKEIESLKLTSINDEEVVIMESNDLGNYFYSLFGDVKKLNFIDNSKELVISDIDYHSLKPEFLNLLRTCISEFEEDKLNLNQKGIL